VFANSERLVCSSSRGETEYWDSSYVARLSLCCTCLHLPPCVFLGHLSHRLRSCAGQQLPLERNRSLGSGTDVEDLLQVSCAILMLGLRIIRCEVCCW
jgi:hypothetical protein